VGIVERIEGHRYARSRNLFAGLSELTGHAGIVNARGTVSFERAIMLWIFTGRAWPLYVG
jgi:hypothetical protein